MGTSRELEAPHLLISNSSRPVRILRSIVQTLVLSMFDAWNQVFFGRPIASEFEFLGDNDSGSKASRFEPLAKERLRCSLVAMRRHQDIEDLTVGSVGHRLEQTFYTICGSLHR